MAVYGAESLCHLVSMHFDGRNISEDAPKRFGADLTVHVTRQSQDEIRRRGSQRLVGLHEIMNDICGNL